MSFSLLHFIVLKDHICQLCFVNLQYEDNLPHTNRITYELPKILFIQQYKGTPAFPSRFHFLQI